jgi:hypothetical protein
VLGHNNTTKWANIFWVRNGGAIVPSGSDMDSLGNLVGDQYSSAFGGLINNQAAIDAVDVTYYGLAGLQIGNKHVEAHAFTMAGTIVPAQVAQCIGWTVQQRYRGGHPRTYLPTPAQPAFTDAQTFAGGHVTSLRNAANSFHAAINAFSVGALTDLHLGTVSFQLHKDWRDPPVFRDYTPGAAVVDSRIDTQRRRVGPDR